MSHKSRLKYGKPRTHVLPYCMLLQLILVTEPAAAEFVLTVVGNHRGCCVTVNFCFWLVFKWRGYLETSPCVKAFMLPGGPLLPFNRDIRFIPGVEIGDLIASRLWG